MFEQKEQEAKTYNQRNKVQNSSASKPVALKEKTNSSQTPYHRKKTQNQQKKEDVDKKYMAKHKNKENNNSNLQSRIAMFSKPNHGLPTAKNLNAKSSEPKTSHHAGSASKSIAYLRFSSHIFTIILHQSLKRNVNSKKRRNAKWKKMFNSKKKRN